MGNASIVFLLGGHDLEMLSVKEILIDNGFGKDIIDENLKWGAELSAYKHQFNNVQTFVGIELVQDIDPPLNYIPIDHHNENSDQKSSLEQVIELLKIKCGIEIEITRDLQKIIANDCGYIPALEKMGATPDEITDIRQKDKDAQRVTEEDERLADISISKSRKYGKLRIVESQTEHFSTITDKLYPFEELLIRHKNSITYYGQLAALLKEKYQALINQKKAYYGGTGSGFFGFDARHFSSEEADIHFNDIKQYAISMTTHSFHIFMFPFTWNPAEKNSKKPFNERFDLKSLRIKNEETWEKVGLPGDKIGKTEQYNERNFFYRFVHPLLYNRPNYESEKKQIETIHFRRKEVEMNEVNYVIKTYSKELPFALHVKEIKLDFFNTGAGVLSFYLSNYEYSDLNDIKKINQFGRRIFPPFLDKANGLSEVKKYELADYIKITGLLGSPNRYADDFTSYSTDQYLKPALFIKSLIQDLDENLVFEPIIDDRMFTMCWTFNSEYSNLVKDKSRYSSFVKSNIWHEYLYVDSGESTCQNDEMQEKLLREHTYPRWQKNGTLYGLTRHSFMAISDESDLAHNVLLTYFRTLYAQMTMLSLIQKATVLSFSNAAADIAAINSNFIESEAIKLNSFYEAYVRFINKIYHREITAQDQGIELYDMLQDNLRIEKQANELKKEINELFSYANFLKTEQTNKRMRLLTITTGLIVIPNFILTLTNNHFFRKMPSYPTCPEIRTTLRSNGILILTIILFSCIIVGGVINWDKKIIRGNFQIKNLGLKSIIIAVILLMVFLLTFQFFI